MEILKKGKIQQRETVRFEGTCRNCQCQIRVTEEEYNSLLPDPSGGGSLVKCPTKNCGYYIRCVKVHYR